MSSSEAGAPLVFCRARGHARFPEKVRGDLVRRRHATVALLLLAFLVPTGIASAADVRERARQGKGFYIYGYEKNYYHLVENWLHVDYTNHRIRPYWRHYSEDHGGGPVHHDMSVALLMDAPDCKNCSASTAYNYDVMLNVGIYANSNDYVTWTSNTYYCGGGHYWQSWGDDFYDVRPYESNNGDFQVNFGSATPMQSAC
jgi:hypothetical protein